MAQQAELETLEMKYTGETAQRIVYKGDADEKAAMAENFEKKLPNAESKTNKLSHKPFQKENEAFKAMEEIRKVEEVLQHEKPVRKCQPFQRGEETFKAENETQRMGGKEDNFPNAKVASEEDIKKANEAFEIMYKFQRPGKFQRPEIDETLQTMYEIQRMEKRNESVREKEGKEMKKLQNKLDELEEGTFTQEIINKIDLEEISSDEGETDMLNFLRKRKKINSKKLEKQYG